MSSAAGIGAVVFDLDGVILQTEEVWDEVRGRYVIEHGGRYDEEAQRAMMGMSAPEWSRYLASRLGVAGTPEKISADIVEPHGGALPRGAAADPAARRTPSSAWPPSWPLGLASSSNRPLIDAALTLSGLDRCFTATVSSEEVARGKPAPDVYLEAARRLDFAERCVAVEDSHSGIRSAESAGMRVIAIPNPSFPPDPAALELADLVLDSIADLDVDAVQSLD